jgi:MerR family transcriptional regulator, redox-sensitive transcriptional activator SoxR
MLVMPIRSMLNPTSSQVSSGNNLLSIGEVAARAGLNTSHIRYYERVGVLPVAERVSGQRRYSEDILHRLAIVAVAQRAGFTLDEIRELTGPQPGGPDARERIRALAERKLSDIDALIERAAAVRSWLSLASACDCATVDVCALFVDPTLSPPPGGVTGRVHASA